MSEGRTHTEEVRWDYGEGMRAVLFAPKCSSAASLPPVPPMFPPLIEPPLHELVHCGMLNIRGTNGSNKANKANNALLCCQRGWHYRKNTDKHWPLRALYSSYDVIPLRLVQYQGLHLRFNQLLWAFALRYGAANGDGTVIDCQRSDTDFSNTSILVTFVTLHIRKNL